MKTKVAGGEYYKKSFDTGDVWVAMSYVSILGFFATEAEAIEAIRAYNARLDLDRGGYYDYE